jgi:hypothetical protein
MALRLPEAQEGVACEGTAAERRTITVRGKAFLFLGASDARLKLHDSLAEATDLAAREPRRYEVGAHGWVKVTFGGASLPVDTLARWIEESYRLLAPSQPVARRPERAPPGAAEEAAKVEAGGKKPRSKNRSK